VCFTIYILFIPTAVVLVGFSVIGFNFPWYKPGDYYFDDISEFQIWRRFLFAIDRFESWRFYLRIECIHLKFHWDMKALTEVHFQWSVRASCWKCISINAFIPQWNFKRMHSILIIKSPKQRLETYCFCSVSSYYYYSSPSPSFFPWTMNLSTADLRNYRTEFHETWWSYRYMFLVGPKVFSFVVKGVKVIFWGVQKGWGLL
jgi:hypothetical protein